VLVRVATAFNRTPYLPGASVRACRSSGGRSGASGDGPLAFSELVDEVGLGHVGLVLALEVSGALLGGLLPPALPGTFIADADGVYSPADFEDRLLLVLTGTIGGRATPHPATGSLVQLRPTTASWPPRGCTTSVT
jgi:hypothetical protein